MTKNIWVFAVLLLLSFLATTNLPKITSSESSDSSPAFRNHDHTSPSIVIGYSNWAGWWPWAIAESEGLFAKHNIDVEMRWYDNYSESMEDLANGYIDGNSQTLNDTITFAENAVKGEVVVLVNDNSAGNDKIIAAKGINKVKELKNKRVAVEAGVVDDFLLTLALEKEGMSRSDVDIVDAETGAATEAFAAGQVDAVGAFPPFWLTALKRKGAKEITSSKDFPGAIPDLLVVTNELVNKHPDRVQALIDTWFDVLDFMAEDPERADEIMADRAGVNSKELQLFKKGTKMFTVEDNLEAFADGENMKHMSFAAQKMTNFLKNSLKSIEQKPKFKRLFDSQFVENIA